MTPSQIHAEFQQRKLAENESKKKEKSDFHTSVSESHKPNMRGKSKSEGEKSLVMLATKSEKRAFCENPNLVHFVRLYKDVTPDPRGLPT